MSDYRKYIEEGKMAKSQGIRVEPKAGEKSVNRIEEFWKHRGAEPLMPALEKPDSAPADYSTALRHSFLFLAILLFAAAAVIGGFYAYKHFRGSIGDLTPEQVVENVGKLVELPAGESPTVATVTDLSELADQPFFTEAKVGDKVLIFSKSGKAILYRPAENKIVVVAPINK